MLSLAGPQGINVGARGFPDEVILLLGDTAPEIPQWICVFRKGNPRKLNIAIIGVAVFRCLPEILNLP